MRYPTNPTPEMWLSWLGERFIPEPNTGCWLWMGAVTRVGYGEMNHLGKSRRAHRVSYELLRGNIPEGLTIDHLCRQHSCVNPAHMEPVTARENGLRGSNAAAKNARKTHCVRGHRLSMDNIWWQGPHRHCRVCWDYYYTENRDRIVERRRGHYADNKDEINRKRREYRRRKAQT